ncbi:MAG TPA: hypothetical protein VGQ08_18505 [Nitrospiraceae bacterium]|jgi:short subunit dehydrogenase-like uncharacterized protein|nr:hypothetical protein [Nitrospiraceae bacterium]
MTSKLIIYGATGYMGQLVSKQAKQAGAGGIGNMRQGIRCWKG